MCDMKELWREARIYGRACLMTMDDGCYHANIKFNTSQHTELVARSSFKHTDPVEALKEVVQAAKDIANELEKAAQDIKQQTELFMKRKKK